MEKICDTCKHFLKCDYADNMLVSERQNDKCESWEGDGTSEK